MQIVQTVDQLRSALSQRPGRRGFVPTMGFLHAGHQTLFERAASECDVAVASVFVNPTQFNDPDDLLKYPRDPEGDAHKARQSGIHVLWMPRVEDIYPPGNATTVSVTGLTDGLCGASRPGHFDGVATVVARLLTAVAAERAYFGQKDYQQLAVIRRLVADLLMPVEIIGVPTVREPDGLAMSSRNVRLGPSERPAAVAIPRGLFAARDGYVQGVRSTHALLQSVRDEVQTITGVVVDYLELVDASTLKPAPAELTPEGHWVLALAAWVGGVRLIDNIELGRAGS